MTQRSTLPASLPVESSDDSDEALTLFDIPPSLLNQMAELQPGLWRQMLQAEIDAALPPSVGDLPLPTGDECGGGGISGRRQAMAALVLGFFAGYGITPSLPVGLRLDQPFILPAAPRVRHNIIPNPNADGSDEVPEVPQRPPLTAAEATALDGELELPRFFRALERRRNL